MAKFRKKPVVIEATQWFKNGDHPQDYVGDEHDPLAEKTYSADFRRENDWEGAVVRRFRLPGSDERVCEHCGVTMFHHGWIDTLEGGHKVCPGDWVITGVKNERYPCKPDIFAATYEAANG